MNIPSQNHEFRKLKSVKSQLSTVGEDWLPGCTTRCASLADFEDMLRDTTGAPGANS